MAPLLPRCLDSLVNQTLREIEIICVDDGSTDNSAVVVQEYAERDPRVRLIRQPNMGRAAARDTGIQAATGEWLGFVDPDDYIEPTMYAVMHQQALATGADMVQCCYDVFSQNDATVSHLVEAKQNREVQSWLASKPNDSVTDTGDLIRLSLKGTITPCVWDKIIRRILPGESGPVLSSLSFNAVRGEDIFYVCRTVKHCRTVSFCKQFLYHYGLGGPQSSFIPGIARTLRHPAGQDEAMELYTRELMQTDDWHQVRALYMERHASGIVWQNYVSVPRLRQWLALWQSGGITEHDLQKLAPKPRYYLTLAWHGKWWLIRLLNLLRLTKHKIRSLCCISWHNKRPLFVRLFHKTLYVRLGQIKD